MKRKNRIRGQEGFTLIEIIAVLILLGILAAVAVPKYMDLTEEARKKAGEAAIAEVQGRYSIAYAKYLLENAGNNPSQVNLILSDADATSIGTDFTVSVTGTDGTTATIKVTAVKDVSLDADDQPSGTWAIPSQF